LRFRATASVYLRDIRACSRKYLKDEPPGLLAYDLNANAVAQKGNLPNVAGRAALATENAAYNLPMI
jgi:hypothetical protein